MSFRIRWKFWGFNPPNPLFSSRLLLDLPIFHFQSSTFVLFPSILCFVLVFLGLNSGDGAEASRAFWSLCVCCLVDSFWDSWILMDTNNWRPAQAEQAMDLGDWRTQLSPDSRQGAVNRMWVLFVYRYWFLFFFSSLEMSWECFSVHACVNFENIFGGVLWFLWIVFYWILESCFVELGDSAHRTGTISWTRIE